MSTAPIIRYQEDGTGTNPDNAVVGEIKTLSNRAIRAVAPLYGPFFTQSLVIYDDVNNRQLVRGVDFQVVELLQSASLRFGKEICQLILIINSNVNERVRYNYQTLGGLFQNSMDNLVNLYETVMADNRPVDWTNVLNKPTQYPPALHQHMLMDIYGFEPVVVELERIRNAIVLSNVPAFEALVDWVKANANKGILIDETLVRADKNRTYPFNVRSINRLNNTVVHWKIESLEDASVYFQQTEGQFSLFQNHGQFSIQTKNIRPPADFSFNIVLRLEMANATPATMVEGVIYQGSNIGPSTGEDSIMNLLNACCVQSPAVKRLSAKALYVCGP